MSGVCTCTAACSEFKGGESNRSGGKRRYSEGEGGEWNRNEKQKEDEIGEEEGGKIGRYETKAIVAADKQPIILS